MNRRAKLSLSADRADAAKEAPSFDDAPTSDGAPSPRARERPPAFEAGPLIKIMAGVAIGAVLLYLVTRKR